MTCRIVPIILALALPSCASPKPEKKPDLSGVPKECTQALAVIPTGSGVKVKVSQWERADSGWRRVADRDGVIGRNGFAAPGEKREGDGKTPSGAYPIGIAFGYAETNRTGLNYHQASENDFWVDDPESPEYNRWVIGKPFKGSFEVLRREDDAYELAAVIEYNTSPIVAGRGSAIFLHVWGGADHPTAGCVALAKADVAALLEWLDASRSPSIVLNPEVR